MVELHREGSALQPAQQACFLDKGVKLVGGGFVINEATPSSFNMIFKIKRLYCSPIFMLNRENILLLFCHHSLTDHDISGRVEVQDGSGLAAVAGWVIQWGFYQLLSLPLQVQVELRQAARRLLRQGAHHRAAGPTPKCTGMLV